MPPPSPFQSESDDPIARPPSQGQEPAAALRPDRPWYATGVRLDAEDFQAEQLYHRARLAAGLRWLGGCGTLTGLRVRWQEATPASGGTAATEEEIVVQPGLAVDRFGRLISLTRPHCLRLNPWLAGLANRDRWLRQRTEGDTTLRLVVADVFIRFLALPRGYTPAVAAGPFDATDAVQPNRIRDSHRLELVPRPGEMGMGDRLPVDPWAPLRTSTVNRWQVLQDLILDGALADNPPPAEGPGEGTLRSRPEHTDGVDPSALFLARLEIPVSPPDDLPLSRLASRRVTVRNDLREFLLSSTALAAWAGVPARSNP
jgi:hypothetical protein